MQLRRLPYYRTLTLRIKLRQNLQRLLNPVRRLKEKVRHSASQYLTQKFLPLCRVLRNAGRGGLRFGE